VAAVERCGKPRDIRVSIQVSFFHERARMNRHAYSLAIGTAASARSRHDAAAAALLELDAMLGAGGVLDKVIGAGGGFEVGTHYPPGEVHDPRTEAQYYYHAHVDIPTDAPAKPPSRGPDHGHFHVFLGAGGMPLGVAPLVLPEMALAPPLAGPSSLARLATERARRERGPVSHLIAITLDAAGQPIALFTTNRWVTGETWYRAPDVVRMLDAFAFTAELSEEPVNRWLSALLVFYRNEIEQLIHARDEAVMDWRRRRRGRVHVFDDRRLEVTSSLPIDLRRDLGRWAARAAR